MNARSPTGLIYHIQIRYNSPHFNIDFICLDLSVIYVYCIAGLTINIFKNHADPD